MALLKVQLVVKVLIGTVFSIWACLTGFMESLLWTKLAKCWPISPKVNVSCANCCCSCSPCEYSIGAFLVRVSSKTGKFVIVWVSDAQGSLVHILIDSVDDDSVNRYRVDSKNGPGKIFCIVLYVLLCVILLLCCVIWFDLIGCFCLVWFCYNISSKTRRLFINQTTM